MGNVGLRLALDQVLHLDLLEVAGVALHLWRQEEILVHRVDTARVDGQILVFFRRRLLNIFGTLKFFS